MANILTSFGQGDDFGHRDYTEARKAGITNAEILKYLEANPDKLIGKNVKGGGGLYDEISTTGQGRDIGDTDLNKVSTEFGWAGNKNTFDPKATYRKAGSSEKLNELERLMKLEKKYGDDDDKTDPNLIKNLLKPSQADKDNSSTIIDSGNLDVMNTGDDNKITHDGINIESAKWRPSMGKDSDDRKTSIDNSLTAINSGNAKIRNAGDNNVFHHGGINSFSNAGQKYLKDFSKRFKLT